MPNPGLTLENIKNTSPKLKPARVIRASDVLSEKEQAQIRQNRERRRLNTPRKKLFNSVDALMAEIIARFGYDTYKAFNSGEIGYEKMMRFLRAEQAREASGKLDLYGIIMAMVGSCIRRHKGDPVPKGPKIAQKIFNEEQKIAKGEM